MPITKDNKKLYIKNGNLPVEFINGISSFIETGSTIKKIELPADYSEEKFPNHSRDEEVKSSVINLSGTFTNNNDHLHFNSGQYAIFDIYPNVEPFNKWGDFKVETWGGSNSVTLQVFNKNNEKLYENTSISSGNSTDGWFIEWNLSNLKLELEELTFKLISNTNNMVISNIFFEYDLNPVDGNMFKYASKVQTVTKKLSELEQGDLVLNYSLIASPGTATTGRIFFENIYINVTMGTGTVSLKKRSDDSPATWSQQAFDYTNAVMLEPFFSFEVQRQTPQDLVDVKKEIFDNIDKIQIETYNNGFRIKKNGVYIYSRCFGSVEMTTTGSNGSTYTTVNYPFTMTGSIRVSMANAMGDPLTVGASTDQTNVDSVRLTLKRVSAGSSSVKWSVESI